MTAPLPPLARGLPVVGSVGAIARHGMITFLESEWRRLGDIFRVKVGPKTLVVVVHPEGVARVLSENRANYIKGRTYDQMRILTGDGLLTLEGNAWMSRRRLEQPAFHKDSIKKLVAAMVRVTDRALTRWRSRFPEGGTIEAHHEMMRLTLEVVGETLFGQALGDELTDQSARAFGDALSLISARANSAAPLPLWLPTPNNRRLKGALATLDAMTYAIIEKARRGSEAPTLLSMLLSARDADTGKALTDTEVRNEVITLFLAGHETTALLLTWGFTLLGRHPEVVERMKNEVDAALGGREPGADDLPRLPYLRQVVDEILRLRSPTWTVGRDAVAEDVVLGHRVCAGDLVMPANYLTHRHASFWDEPDRFDPDRFAPDCAKKRDHWAYFPFSLGPRICIGNIFSLVESQLVLAMLLQAADFQLAPGPEVAPVAQITLRPTAPINVQLRWRPEVVARLRSPA